MQPARMTRTIIVSDLHGDHATCQKLLREQGVLDPNGNREPGWFVIQVGDLIHGGNHEYERDLEMTKRLSWFDVVLLGNHELPHVYPQNGFPSFAGMTPLETRVTDALKKNPVAYVVGEWLITHAALHPYLALREGVPKNASEAEAFLQARFEKRLRSRHPDPLFDWVGSVRGGREPVGGIFWNDRRAIRAHEDFPVKQVFGHTPCPEGYWTDATGTLWCVDAGAALSGKVSALVEDGDGWTPVVTQRPRRGT